MLIKIHKSNCVTVDYRKLTTPKFKENCVTTDQHPAPPCWVLERIDVVNRTRPFSQGRLSHLIDKALREKGSCHARLGLGLGSESRVAKPFFVFFRDVVRYRRTLDPQECSGYARVRDHNYIFDYYNSSMH